MYILNARKCFIPFSNTEKYVEKKIGAAECFFNQLGGARKWNEILYESWFDIASQTINNSTGGDNSNKRCLSNTRSQLKSSRKFGSSSRILGIHSRTSRFFSAMSRNYRVFPGKISKCPDSRRNLQISGTILALSRNSVC